MATTATNINEVCQAMEQALRRAGFFGEGGSDADRLAMVEPAVAEASRRLGIDLVASRDQDHGLCTVTAEGVAGLVTIVPQRGIEKDGRGSLNPDFGLTWSMT